MSQTGVQTGYSQKDTVPLEYYWLQGYNLSMSRQGTPLTPETKELFLAALRASPNVSEAARAADISRISAYKYRDTDPEFKEAWDDALEEAIDTLEREAQRRAFEGCDEPVGWHQGVAGGTVKRYSDNLAMFLLKAHKPDRFRDNLHLSGGVAGANEKLEEVSLSLLQKLDKMIDDETEGGGDGDSSA